MSVQLSIKFFGTIIELLLPWMLSVILDTYAPAKNLPMIWLWGVLMVICAALALAANIIANQMSTRISRDITRSLRHDLFVRITALTAAEEDSFTTPSLISRLSSDTYNVHQMIDRMTRLGVRAPILMIGGVIVTFVLEPVLTCVLFAALPVLALVITLVSRFGIRLYTQSQTALDALIRRAQESMAGIRVIQALSKTEFEKNHFDQANKDASAKDQQADILMSLTNPTMNLVLNIGISFVIIAGAYRVNAGVTQPGMIIAFLSYFTIIINSLMMVSRLFTLLSKGSASGRRIAEVMESPYKMPVKEIPIKKDSPFIQFDSVSFSYNKVRNNLTDISFSLERGETLGVIGPTGSGKSTILRLLLRFYDVDAGRVLINGGDVRSIPIDILYTMFGVVFQNDFLYADEIRENIDFGRGLSDEQIQNAADVAQAKFINDFSVALASKGANFSGGQKQRILLARALAGSPGILLLDDSSSALDYKTDANVRKALAQNFSGTTKIIVAQRVSAIRGADKILVLEDGRGVGYGRHEDLMQNCKIYREIVEIQMGDAG